ncbi:hypothetical protein [Streptomyces sp. NPDC005012]|uniref:hypothetical protein n=1 Tax=Streptomyces sp. NPDC005012 TaxID=3154558 RepID=UPI00339F3C18
MTPTRPNTDAPHLSGVPLAITDHHEVFLGSTNDGHTFAVLNSDKRRYLRPAHHVLTKAGFAPVDHRGRIVYLLPPTDTLHQAGQAMYELCAHTADMADLAWTARPRHADPQVRILFTGNKVSIVTDSPRARVALRQLGTVNENANGDFALSDSLTEREKVRAVVRIDLRLDRQNITSHIDLGIATPAAIPPGGVPLLLRGEPEALTPTPYLRRVCPRSADIPPEAPPLDHASSAGTAPPGRPVTLEGPAWPSPTTTTSSSARPTTDTRSPCSTGPCVQAPAS